MCRKRALGHRSSAQNHGDLTGRVVHYSITIAKTEKAAGGFYAELENSIGSVPSLEVSRPRILGLIDRVLSAMIRLTETYLTGRYFCLKVAIAAIVLSMLMNFPPYRWMVPALREGRSPTLRAMQLKVQHPLAQIPAELKDPTIAKRRASSHVNKMELRLTIPVLGWISHTGIWTIVVWNHLAGFAFFYLLAALALRALQDQVSAALFVVGLGPTAFGASFFSDYFFGDGVAFFLMLLSVAWRRPVLACLTYVAAGFCDERVILAAPLLIFYLLVRYAQEQKQSQGRLLSLAIVAGVVLWAVLRLILARKFHLATGMTDIATPAILRGTLSGFPEPFLGVFRSSWILFPVALLSLFTRRNWISLLTLLAAFAMALGPAFLVWDFSRSLGYVLVAFLISLYFLQGDREASRKFLAAVLGLNLLYGPLSRSILQVAGWVPPFSKTPGPGPTPLI
jgi:hypothetical protein